MSREELKKQIQEGVVFLCYEEQNNIIGVMGIQDKNEVNLIRHAYTRTNKRGKGIGGTLIQYLINESEKPILVGTWKAASWAIRFYEKHGFTLSDEQEKNRLLNRYWHIPARQVETSVVLSNQNTDVI